MTFNLGGEKYKIPTQVHLHINALNRKTENMRKQVRGLEERLKQFGEKE